MKAITLTQPWAMLVAIGAKKIETRSWSTSYRGPLAIHAAQGLAPVGGNRGLNRLIADEPFWTILGAAGCTLGRRAPQGMPFGAIIATCTLVECVSTTFPPSPRKYHARLPSGEFKTWGVNDQEQAFGDYTSGRFAWLLTDVQMLPEPVPAKGALGLWEWNGLAPNS